MAEDVVVKAETVQAWAVQPTDDGSQTAVIFKVKTGTAGFSFPPGDFDRFAERIIAKAGKLVGAQVPDATPQATSSMSIEINPDDSSSALLAVEVGKQRLVFAVDVNTLLGSCKQFLEQRRISRASGSSRLPQ
jgi:hypothetical protein